MPLVFHCSNPQSVKDSSGAGWLEVAVTEHLRISLEGNMHPHLSATPCITCTRHTDAHTMYYGER